MIAFIPDSEAPKFSSSAMAAQEQGARYRYYKRLLLDIGTRLGREDIQALVVTQDLPDDLKTASGVGVLRMLEKGGLFSDRKISPLAELLRGISRHDLTNNYVQEYSETFRSRGDSPDVDVEGIVILCSRVGWLSLQWNQTPLLGPNRVSCCLSMNEHGVL